MLLYQERQEHWEWCRAFIDRETIYRAGPKAPPIPSKIPGQFYRWQVYLRRATLNAEFAHRLGLLFWDHFKPEFERQPFQVGGCIPSGVPVSSAISNTARNLGIKINTFLIRREPKSFGTDNWFDGVVLPNIPVLLVDDVAASANHLRQASARVQVKLRLPLHKNYFTLTNKVGRGFSKEAQHTENYLDNELISFYTMNNFCQSYEDYCEKYGEEPNWTGVVK